MKVTCVACLLILTIWYLFSAGRQTIAILDVDGNNTFKKEMKTVGDDWTLAANTGEVEVDFYFFLLVPLIPNFVCNSLYKDN